MQAARTWWADLLTQQPACRGRSVKLLLRSEDGRQHPGSCFVQPLVLGRALPGPQEAARFVGLLGLREVRDGRPCWCGCAACGTLWACEG
jgi:hypothetical protein